jgi:hypothetical protein
MRKTAFEIVSAAFEALEKLKPTPKEIKIMQTRNKMITAL